MSEARPNHTPSEAVALVPDAREVRELVKNAAPEDKITRAMMKELANRRFGKAKLTPAELGALSEWAFETGVSLNHVTLFGGQPYIMAEGYMEQAAILYPNSAYEFVNVTDRTDRRAFWDAPPHATAVYEVHFWRNRTDRDHDRAADVIECNWAPRTLGTNEYGKLLDQVGIDNPGKTARTRAARRALRYIVPIGKDKARQLEERLKVLHAQAKALDVPEPPRIPLQLPDDPYQVTAGPDNDAYRLNAGIPEDVPTNYVARPGDEDPPCRYCGVTQSAHADADDIDHVFYPPIDMEE